MEPIVSEEIWERVSESQDLQRAQGLLVNLEKSDQVLKRQALGTLVAKVQVGREEVVLMHESG